LDSDQQKWQYNGNYSMLSQALEAVELLTLASLGLGADGRPYA
jgi:hypothetical protein